MRQSLLLWVGCIPALILLTAVSIERLWRKRKGERPPFSEKLLRSPGYSLQRKLEDLNDSFLSWFMGTCLFSFLIFGPVPFAPSDYVIRLVSFIVFGLGSVVCAIMTWRKLHEMRTYQMGLLGEQAVAEELQRLIPSGYKIFHDIPCEKRDIKWNIDHVAVGPAGVFAIETKCRTKKPGKNGGHDHEAIFDGKTIQFSSGDYDPHAVGQARDNARWLEKELSKAIGDPVTVQPVVALPGWWVTLKANSDVMVLSGKQIYHFISTEPTRYHHKFIHQISYQLEQRCRDVEF
jgi:hypothetical protein